MHIDLKRKNNIKDLVEKSYSHKFNLRRLRTLTLFSNVILFLVLITVNSLILNNYILYYYLSICNVLSILFLVLFSYCYIEKNMVLISFIVYMLYYGLLIIIILNDDLNKHLNYVYSSLLIFSNNSFIILSKFSKWNRITIVFLNLLFHLIYSRVRSITLWSDIIFTIFFSYFINVLDFYNHNYILLKFNNDDLKKLKHTFLTDIINNLNLSYCIIDKESEILFNNSYFDKNMKYLLKCSEKQNSEAIYKLLNNVNIYDENNLNIKNIDKVKTLNLSLLKKIENSNSTFNIKIDEDENLNEIIIKYRNEDLLDSSFRYIGKYKYCEDSSLNRAMMNDSNTKLFIKTEFHSQHFNVYLRRSNLLEINNHIEIIFMEDKTSCTMESAVRDEKDQLKAKIAHEFKTPLISIQCIIDKILEETLNIENLIKVKYLSEILLMLIEDITIDNVKSVTYNISTIKLHDMYSYLENLGKSLINLYNKELNLNIDIDNEIFNKSIFCDEKRFKQVIINLLSNSIKYSIGNEVRIIVKINKNDIINFIIEDTGPGLDVDRILYINSNVKTVMKQKTIKDYAFNKGTGIGFLICKKLCKDMNIPISCQLIRDEEYLIKGTRFTLNICMEREESFEIVSTETIRENKTLELDAKFKDLICNTTNDDDNTTNKNDICKISSENVNEKYICIETEEKTFSKLDYDKNANCTENNKKKPISSKSSRSVIQKFNKNHGKMNSTDQLKKIFDKDILIETNIDFIILIVDDVKEIRDSHLRLFYNILQKKFPCNNFKIEVLQDGIEIIFKVYSDIINGRNKIKLIISDEMMEYINGSDASNIINKITKSKNIKKIPFVICSAFNDSSHMEKMKNAFVDEILVKTLQKSVVENIIYKYLKDFLK